jgi:hypothetical protein
MWVDRFDCTPTAHTRSPPTDTSANWMLEPSGAGWPLHRIVSPRCPSPAAPAVACRRGAGQLLASHTPPRHAPPALTRFSPAHAPVPHHPWTPCKPLRWSQVLVAPLSLVCTNWRRGACAPHTCRPSWRPQTAPTSSAKCDARASSRRRRSRRERARAGALRVDRVHMSTRPRAALVGRVWVGFNGCMCSCKVLQSLQPL